jgi:V8-like Glu-specific endopeptidase
MTCRRPLRVLAFALLSTTALGAVDNRKRVQNTLAYSAVGYLEATFAKGEKSITEACTGTLINRYQILTAGHCVYAPIYGYATEVNFVPACNGSEKEQMPFGILSAGKIHLPQGYAKFVDEGVDNQMRAAELDMAVVDLRENVAKEITALPLVPRDKTFFDDATNVLLSIGYPVALGQGTQWYSIAPSHSFKFGNLFRHSASVTPGNSGGPVLHINSKGEAFIVGITVATPKVLSASESEAAVAVTSSAIASFIAVIKP